MNSWVVFSRSSDSRWPTDRHIWSKPILAITWYWIEILTSNFVRWYPKTKPYDILLKLFDSRWPSDRHIWSKPIFGHNSVLDGDTDFKFCALVPKNEQLNCFFFTLSDSRWPTDCHIWSKPIFGHNSVLDWDIDFKFCVLVPQNEQLNFFLRCPIQDGRLTAIYGRNLFLAITQYWIKILASNFVC